ncbi:MAG: hypothetical protein QM796_13915 [Chthoniobacteraceae bacterium]
MKLLVTVLALGFVGFGITAHADDQTKAKPYALKKCFISGDEFDGDMGKPVTFTYKGQEIKLCCHDCEREFKANPDKFLKKYQDTVKKEAKSSN